MDTDLPGLHCPHCLVSLPTAAALADHTRRWHGIEAQLHAAEYGASLGIRLLRCAIVLACAAFWAGVAWVLWTIGGW